jgi:hypothetical protein
MIKTAKRFKVYKRFVGQRSPCCPFMKKLALALFLLLCFFVKVAYYNKKPTPKYRSCIHFPVSFFPFKDQPLIRIEIANKTYALHVDLGSSHPIDLQKKLLKKISRKKPIGIFNYIGMKGKTYPVQGFELPPIHLAPLTINSVIACEESSEFHQDAQTWLSNSLLDRCKDLLEEWSRDGRIGWTFFREAVLLVDFPNSSLFMAKDLLSLKEAGHSLDTFFQVPFEERDKGLFLWAETDRGSQKFFLDTGATASIMKQKRDETNPFYITSCLKIGSHNLGPWEFVVFEFGDHLECDGILGVDFFKKYAVCFDFHNHIAYIEKERTP